MTDPEPRLTLWPSGYEPEGLTLPVAQVEKALEDYFASGWVAQGPDYYVAALQRIGREPDQLQFGDLAWAVLLAGGPRPAAAQSFLHATPIDLTSIPTGIALQDPNASSPLQAVVDAIRTLRGLDHIKIAIAVKLLHPARPELVPVMDRSSFFGAYFHQRWRFGQNPMSRDPDDPELLEGLKAVRRVVADDVNAAAWQKLDGWTSSKRQGPFTRVQLFDALWWVLHRDPQRVGFDHSAMRNRH